MPSLLPGTRWALTPPFHPYRSRRSGGLLSVALSLGSPRAGVTRRLFTVEPGLSSTEQAPPRPPGRLTRRQMGRKAAGVNRGGVKARLDCARVKACPRPRPNIFRTRPQKQRANVRFGWLGNVRDWPRRTPILQQAAISRAKRPMRGSRRKWPKPRRHSSAKAIEEPLPAGCFRCGSRRSFVGAPLVDSTGQRQPRTQSIPSHSGRHSRLEDIAGSMAVWGLPRYSRASGGWSQDILSPRPGRPPRPDHAHLQPLSGPGARLRNPSQARFAGGSFSANPDRTCECQFVPAKRDQSLSFLIGVRDAIFVDAILRGRAVVGFRLRDTDSLGCRNHTVGAGRHDSKSGRVCLRQASANVRRS